MDKDNIKIINFLSEIEKFKFIKRYVYLSDEITKEDDAQHSWHLAMFILLFEKEFPKDLDRLKMLKLALIHDLPEIYAGDVFAFDTKGREGKEDKELKAANKLFDLLPTNLRNEFMDLFLEYENKESKEAMIVKSFDKLQPIHQTILSKGKSWKEHNISVNKIDEYKRSHVQHDEFLKELYEYFLNEAESIIKENQ